MTIYAYEAEVLPPEAVHIIDFQTTTFCGIDTTSLRWRHTDQRPIANGGDAPICLDCEQGQASQFGES